MFSDLGATRGHISLGIVWRRTCEFPEVYEADAGRLEGSISQIERAMGVRTHRERREKEETWQYLSRGSARSDRRRRRRLDSRSECLYCIDRFNPLRCDAGSLMLFFLMVCKLSAFQLDNE
jgi:hypothetical protein